MYAKQLINGLVACVMVLLIVAALPLVAVLVFAARGVAMAAGLAGLVVGAAVYMVSPAFRAWFQALAEPLIQYRGLRLAKDVTLYPSHSWARMEDEVQVGADDLVQAALGPVDGIELPADGTHVERGQPLFRLHHGDRAVSVPSPVTGTVIGVNTALRGHPELVNDEPFEHGWAVRIHSDDPRGDRRLLLRGKQARNWFRTAVDGVLGSLPDSTSVATERSAAAGPLHRRIDDRTWRQLTETIFATPSNELHPTNAG